MVEVPVLPQRPENQEKTSVPAQVSRANSPFLRFLILFRPSVDWMVTTTLVRSTFTQSTDSNANYLCGNTISDTARNNVSPARWASLSWHITLTFAICKSAYLFLGPPSLKTVETLCPRGAAPSLTLTVKLDVLLLCPKRQHLCHVSSMSSSLPLFVSSLWMPLTSI